MVTIMNPYGVSVEAFGLTFPAGSPAFTSDASASSYITGALAIGAEDINRCIGLLVCSFGAHVSSGTIGGVALTVAGTVQSSAGTRRISLIHAPVPTGGTTAVVDLTMSGTASYCCIDLVRVAGVVSSTPNNQGTVASNSVAATVPAGGAAFAAYITDQAVARLWTNATELHETILTGTGMDLMTGASFTSSATVSTDGSVDDAIAYMAWGP